MRDFNSEERNMRKKTLLMKIARHSSEAVVVEAPATVSCANDSAVCVDQMCDLGVDLG